ncbi:MAG: GlsB/YeaQ/YmgE family stress response membrane protein [Gemmatimonadota bacterium]
MGLLWTILIGFVIGSLAKFLLPGKDPSGFLVTTLLGICGSWFGSWIFGLVGWGGGAGFIGSVIGAVLLLVIYRAVKNKS